MPSTIDKPLAITLVHGTWADANAKWVQRDSILCQQLYAEFAQVEIHAFPWSGKNSVGARKMAAEDLRRHVESVFERISQADHFVIGHSHGGSVALYAVKDEEIRK